MPISHVYSLFSAGLNISIKQEREGGPLVQKHKKSNDSVIPMYDYIEQGESLTIFTTVESQGDITYLYEFGDGRNVSYDLLTNVTYNYSVWKTDPPYLLVLTASNPFTSANITMEIPVQMPVQNLTGFTLSVPDANSSQLAVRLY